MRHFDPKMASFVDELNRDFCRRNGPIKLSPGHILGGFYFALKGLGWSDPSRAKC